MSANVFHESRDGHVPGIPASNTWNLCFSSDCHGHSEIFKGFPIVHDEAGCGGCDGLPFHGPVTVAPCSVLIYSQQGHLLMQMKRYQIVHRTTYSYAAPVQLGPHSLRLRPRAGHDLRIESSMITIQPMASLRWHRDVESNSVAIATFEDSSDLLLIESSLIIQHYDLEPLDFLVEDYAVFYPFAYAPEDRPVLDAYRHAVPAPQAGPLAQWTSTVWQPGEAIESYALLQRLNLAIHEHVAYRQREEPGVQTPAETLGSLSGSCRDLAFLFMEAAKLLGFAARFVSGYSFTSQAAGDAGSTHAWAEVFLPGAGWKGFDPTRGAIVGENHIPVAVGRLPHAVPPIAGSFIGDSHLLSMDVAVRVTELER